MNREDVTVKAARELGIKPKMVKKAMFEQSERIKKKPARLFHATHIDNFDSIKKNGILPHAFYGQVYLCEDPLQCLRFIKKPCVIFEVDTKQLDIKKMVYSRDHSKRVYNFDVYAYYKTIFPSALKDWEALK